MPCLGNWQVIVAQQQNGCQSVDHFCANDLSCVWAEQDLNMHGNTMAQVKLLGTNWWLLRLNLQRTTQWDTS